MAPKMKLGKPAIRSRPRAFDSPVYVTRPILPDLDAYVQKLREIWDTYRLTNAGPNHQALEQMLGRTLQTSHLSLFNNGTSALCAGLKALELQGEVITTPFTFPATTHALNWVGMKPVFADIDPVTMTLDPRAIEMSITKDTSAILAVHVYGIPCDVVSIQKIADRHRLRVIYDGAHAFQAKVRSRPIHTFGDMTMLSFHATKMFHTGEGGALICQTPSLKKRVDLLKNFGIEDETSIALPGVNGKMNELQAALGLLTLEMLPAERAERVRIMKMYHERLGKLEGVFLPIGLEGIDDMSLQYFPIRIDAGLAGKSRDQVHDDLKAYNVFSRKYFYPLCSEYECYRSLPSASPDLLPVSHKVVSEVLVLPFYGGLTNDDVSQICESLEYILS